MRIELFTHPDARMPTPPERSSTTALPSWASPRRSLTTSVAIRRRLYLSRVLT